MNSKINTVLLSNKITIAYSDVGSIQKPVILFIHGLANYRQVWDSNTQFLKNNFRCIAVDLPGNGQSSRQDIQYGIEFFTKIIAEFIDALKLDKVTLAGHSMGGHIAMNLALNFPKRIEKLILCAPSGFEYYSPNDASLFKSAISFGNFLNLDEVQITQSIQNSFYQSSKISAQIIQDLTLIIQKNDRILYRKMLEQCIHSMLDHQLFSKLKNIQQSTLVFFGENDMLIPNRYLHPVSTVDIAKKACAEISNSHLISFPQTGHFVQIERVNEVDEHILNFMNTKGFKK